MLENIRQKEINGETYYVAKEVFKLFCLYFQGEKSINTKNIKKEWYILDKCYTHKYGLRTTLLINKLAVHKLSAFGSNSVSIEYFTKNSND